MILLDTHVLVWFLSATARLGRQAHEVIELAWNEQGTAVSAITFWEVAMLHERGRLALLTDIGSWRKSLLAEGVTELPIDGGIGIRAARLLGFHGDPADRLIVATALEGHQLLTADQKILAWPGNLHKLDATV